MSGGISGRGGSAGRASTGSMVHECRPGTTRSHRYAFAIIASSHARVHDSFRAHATWGAGLCCHLGRGTHYDTRASTGHAMAGDNAYAARGRTAAFSLEAAPHLSRRTDGPRGGGAAPAGKGIDQRPDRRRTHREPAYRQSPCALYL